MAPRNHNPGTHRSYAWIVQSTALVNHYYFYCLDRDCGPFFLKFCSYFPGNAKLYLNGHEYVKRQLEPNRKESQALDNGVLSCADPKRLQVLSDGLSAEKIEARLRKWLRLLPHPFAGKDRQAGYRYQLSILQMALSLTQRLDRPVSGRIFCEEVIRENLDIGCPKQPGLVSNVCRRSRWYSARVKLAATMVSTSSATRSRSMAGITAYNSSSPSPVYVRLPMDSALATAPLASLARAASFGGVQRTLNFR